MVRLDELNYIPDSGLWEKDSRLFIKSEFDPLLPCLIEICADNWTTSWKGQAYSIPWSNYSLPPDILKPIKEITLKKIMSGVVAATHLSQISQMLANLEKDWPSHCGDYSKLGIAEFSDIWDGLPAHSRSTFRQILNELASSGKYESLRSLAIRTKQWKARSNVKTLKGVLGWNPQSGALTSAEMELLRDGLAQFEDQSDKDHCIRLLCLVMLELVKRTQQYLSIKADGLKLIESNGISEYFLEIPKAKNQTGTQPDLWPISATLAKEIQIFSRRPEVKALQRAHNRIFLWKSQQLFDHGQISSSNAESAIRDHIKKLNIISPRTSKRLHVTPYRLRHTGATHMAMQGVSMQVIQHILEHDDSTSAQAYIDAIGSDLVPAIERADRKLGDLFKELNNAFFKGKVTTDLTNSRVYIPIFSVNPMPVGSCGRDPLKLGQCKKNPFVACYNGCKDFLAWRDADHFKALAFVENELKRWSEAEGQNARSKAIKDFEQLHHAITQVISQVEEGNADASA